MAISKLHYMWVVGFVDGEGCFRASLIRNSKLRSGIQIQPEFVVTQHKRDIDLLYKLKSVFGCGIVSQNKGKEDFTDQTFKLRVRKINDLCTKILPFFEKHSLKTKKKVEFLRFRQLCNLLQKKVHLTKEGFEQCLQLVKQIPYDNEKSFICKLFSF
jgi:hypothetical protein